MQQDPIAKLGDKMRTVYEDVAAEVPAAQPSRRRRGGRPRRAVGAPRPRETLDSRLGSVVTRHPLTALLALVGVGFLVSLAARDG